MPSRKLKVTLLHSPIGLKPGHVRTIQALGLRRIRATVVHDDTPVIQGMIARVSYALGVEAADDASAAGQSRRAQKTKERSV